MMLAQRGAALRHQGEASQPLLQCLWSLECHLFKWQHTTCSITRLTTQKDTKMTQGWHVHTIQACCA